MRGRFRQFRIAPHLRYAPRRARPRAKRLITLPGGGNDWIRTEFHVRIIRLPPRRHVSSAKPRFAIPGAHLLSRACGRIGIPLTQDSTVSSRRSIELVAAASFFQLFVARRRNRSPRNFRTNFYHELRKKTSIFSGKISFHRVTGFMAVADAAVAKRRSRIAHEKFRTANRN